MQANRESFCSVAEIVQRVRARLDILTTAGEPVDYLTFVPEGEPTLDAGLGREIEALKPFGVKVAVFTNGSLLWREDVRAELMDADLVSLKFDAVQHNLWRRINRPYRGFELERLIDGMYTFAKSYKGQLVSETMLVNGLNDSRENIENIATVLQRFRLSTAYILTPTRPPAEEWVEPAGREALARARALFCKYIAGVDVLVEYEGNTFVCAENIERELLAITAVHPLREDGVRELLARAEADWSVVDRLIRQGRLLRREFKGKTFYVKQRRTDNGSDKDIPAHCPDSWPGSYG
jgi:wyosine [tRNA(Phe)-imidazoG37] synthetase (radical SAM superfamily)